MGNAVLACCEAVNMGYDTPMQYSEVKAIAKSIAKSIAKWTMRHFTPAKFSESQARKGRRRPVDQRSDTQLKSWEPLGISRRTYYNRKKLELL